MSTQENMFNHGTCESSNNFYLRAKFDQRRGLAGTACSITTSLNVKYDSLFLSVTIYFQK